MKIQLRPYILQDQNQLVLLANNPNVSANLNDQFPYPFTNQDALNCINKANQPNSRIIEFAITVDRIFCGAISFTFGHDIYSHCGEIGYWLGQPYWNLGIMNQAIKQMIEYIFTNYDTKIIVARVFSRNLASKKILVKNNFELLVSLKNYGYKRGEFLNIELYELTIEKYQLSLKNQSI